MVLLPPTQATTAVQRLEEIRSYSVSSFGFPQGQHSDWISLIPKEGGNGNWYGHGIEQGKVLERLAPLHVQGTRLEILARGKIKVSDISRTFPDGVEWLEGSIRGWRESESDLWYVVTGKLWVNPSGILATYDALLPESMIYNKDELPILT